MKTTVFTAKVIEAIRAEVTQPGHRPIREIAEELGVPRGSVLSCMRRNRISSANVEGGMNAVMAQLYAAKDRIKAMVAGGMNGVEIAAELGVDYVRLWTFSYRAGISLRGATDGRDLVDAIEPSERSLVSARPANSFGRTFSRQQKKTAIMDEMRVLADAAIAAGHITRCPPGQAMGLSSWENLR